LPGEGPTETERGTACAVPLSASFCSFSGDFRPFSSNFGPLRRLSLVNYQPHQLLVDLVEFLVGGLNQGVHAEIVDLAKYSAGGHEDLVVCSISVEPSANCTNRRSPALSAASLWGKRSQVLTVLCCNGVTS
jgi:hypothetical protein